MKDILIKLAADTKTQTGTHVKPVTDSANTEIETAIPNILNGVIGVLALVAVVVIIIGGIGYMTSSGDASKVKKSKDTILYGLIGLVVCVLAFAIVNFVVRNILGNS